MLNPNQKYEKKFVISLPPRPGAHLETFTIGRELQQEIGVRIMEDSILYLKHLLLFKLNKYTCGILIIIIISYVIFYWFHHTMFSDI